MESDVAVSGGTAITGAEDDTTNKTEGLQIRRVWRQRFRRDQRPAACPAVLRNPEGMLAGPPGDGCSWNTDGLSDVALAETTDGITVMAHR